MIKTATTQLMLILLSGFFFLAGATKVTGGMVDQFSSWGYPGMLSYGIGSLELAAAVLLVFSRTRVHALKLLIPIMMVANGTHLYHGEIAGTILTFGLFAVLGGYALTYRKPVENE